MAILVTGGAGFIGSNFILDWTAANNEPVINLDKLTYAGNLRNLDGLGLSNHYAFVHGGIEDTVIVGEILRRNGVRAVVNFAAESHVDRSIHGPSAFIETNVVGTMHLLEAVRAYWSTLSKAGREMFRFLHVSTDEVYGSLDPGAAPFTEQHPFRPNSPYAASKAASDHLVRSYHETYGLPVLTTNCSNNYGPFHFPEKLIPLIIHNALSGKPLPVYGDGQQVRDWIHVKDHCAALRRVLEAGRPGETYNIGGRSEMANLDVVRTVCGLLDMARPRDDDRSYDSQIVHVADRPGHDRRYAIDASKIERELGWAAAMSFAAGIAKTVDWYLANPDWVANVTSGAYRVWIEKQYA
ncbi:MAG TPA: dTDP-glucose 4,6-dehydratase [Arsenicitalea sp.]|nr:dTDP-glucose 4,6-dehydratase [Arsenicitalea sp.]